MAYPGCLIKYFFVKNRTMAKENGKQKAAARPLKQFYIVRRYRPGFMVAEGIKEKEISKVRKLNFGEMQFLVIAFLKNGLCQT